MADDVVLNVGSGGDTMAADEIGGVKFQRIKLIEGADGVNDGDVSSANPLPIEAPGVISTANSTVTPLGISATFTGTSEEITNYSSIVVSVFADEASAVNGLSFEFSTDGINWDLTEAHSILASEGEPFILSPEGQFFRLVYTNGGTAQTLFRLETVFKRSAVGASFNHLDAALKDKDVAATVRAVLSAQRPDTSYVNIGASSGGSLKIDVEEIGGVAPSLDTGVRDAGTQRVTVATDDLVPISASSLPLPTGAATAAGQLADGHNVAAAGDVAHDVADSGNPIKVGGKANVNLPAAVGEDDRINAAFDLQGQLRTLNTNIVSTDNSTTATLGIGATFTGTGEDVAQYSAVAITIHSSHDSAVDGMTFQFSTDDVNWDEEYIFTYSAANGARRFQFPVTARYFRIVYTNGGTAQTTFRVQTILHAHDIGTSIHRLVDSIDPDRSATLVKAILTAQAAGSGDFVPVQATAAGNFKMSMEEINGVAPSLDTGVRDAGTQRVTVATDDLVPISAASLPLPAGAATAAGQLVDGHAVTVDNTVGSPANVQIGDGTDQANITALSDAFANPTVLETGAFMMGWGGSSWDRVNVSAATLDGVSASSIGRMETISLSYGYNGTTFDRLRSDITNGLDVDVTRTPADGIDGAAHGASQVGFRMMGTDGTNDQQISVDVLGFQTVKIADNISHGAVDSGAPVKIGGHANAGLRTAVGEDDRVDSSYDLAGQARVIAGVTTSGGATKYKNLDVDNTEDAVKTSTGQIYWIHCINLGSAVRYLKFYDATVASVVVGTTVPDLTFPVPTQGDSNGAGFVLSIPGGIPFGTAITVAATTGFADNDSVDPGANEVILNLGFA